MNRTIITTHHVLQQSLTSHFLIQFLGGRTFIEQSINKLHLTSSDVMAGATGTPLHAGNHPWIRNAQEARLDDFLRRDYGGHTARQLITDPTLNPAQFDLMQADAQRYVADLRDTTARALIRGDMALTLGDPRFPGLTSGPAQNLVDNVLSPERFAEGNTAALARQAELVDYRAARTAIETAGADSRWVAFDTPERTLAYIQEAEQRGFNIVNGREATASSLDGFVRHVDDGRIAEYTNAWGPEHGVPGSRWSRIPLAGKLGIIGLAATTIYSLTQAANAQTVEERNRIVQDVAVVLALEAVVVVAGLPLLPAVIVSAVGYALYQYATDPELGRS